ncbi:MAG: choice-of-anchor Q domain-containing protein, partial [Caldilineaceae bacterium]
AALTLTNVAFAANRAGTNGGAVFVQGPAMIDGGHFERNAAGRGGALYVSGAATIRDTEFISNAAQSNGGGVYAAAAIVVNDARFIANSAADGAGGGLYTLQHVQVVDSAFVGNRAKEHGGGMIVWADQGVVAGAYFADNQAERYGGGLYAQHSLDLSGTILLRNSAGLGGGIYVGHADTTGVSVIRNCLLAGNMTPGGADAMYLMPVWGQGGSVGIAHTTIAGAIFSAYDAVRVDQGVLDLENSIVANHAVGIWLDTATMSGHNNLFYANTVDVNAAFSAEETLQGQDPRFIDPGNDDYRLGDGSPAIDSARPSTITVDLLGNPRPESGGNLPDRGAFERQHGRPDVAVAQSIQTPFGASRLLPGDVITFTVTFSSAGSATATGIRMYAEIPAIIALQQVVSRGPVLTEVSSGPDLRGRFRICRPASWEPS